MNFILVGVFAGMRGAGNASLVVMLSHGFVSAALFLTVGNFFYLGKTRSMYFATLNKYTFARSLLWLYIFLPANFGAPPAIACLGEIMLFTFIFSFSSLAGLALVAYCVAACYMCAYFIVGVAHGAPLAPGVSPTPTIGLPAQGLCAALVINLLLVGILLWTLCRDAAQPNHVRIPGLLSPSFTRSAQGSHHSDFVTRENRAGFDPLTLSK